MRNLIWIAPLLVACGGGGDDGGGKKEGCGAAETVVEIETDDALYLYADYQAAPSKDSPAVVLLHMNPLVFDRSSYPVRIRDAFNAEGYAVFNLDRRGAGASEGTPEDAFQSEDGGRLDVEAAMDFLTDPARDCGIDESKVAIIAASNGTTSAVDYTIGHDGKYPRPDGLVMLSPGTYTETQNQPNHIAMKETPALWMYNSREADYPMELQTGAPIIWEFVERGDEHGTDMFDGGSLETDTMADILDFLERTFGDDE